MDRDRQMEFTWPYCRPRIYRDRLGKRRREQPGATESSQVLGTWGMMRLCSLVLFFQCLSSVNATRPAILTFRISQSSGKPFSRK